MGWLISQKYMRKKRIDRDIVTLLIITLITLASWVGFEVYRAYTRREVPEVLASHLRELSPKLNTGVLRKLELRIP